MKGQPELNYSEKPAIEQFKKLGYKEVKQKELINQETLLIALKQINQNLPDTVLLKAIKNLLKEQSLTEVSQANKSISLILKKQISIKEVNKVYPVKFLDFENPENNIFEYSQQQNLVSIIPDILIYVNGLPLSIIEAKSPTLSMPIKEGIKQLKSYEKKAKQLFNFIQIETVISMTNAVYGTYNTPEDKFSPGETIDNESKQDSLINMLYKKENFLELFNDFILDTKTKKIIARYIQYRAAKKTIKKLKEGKGGIIFHSQGSGKSYTMVYISRLILKYFNRPTIVIVTDRVDLDDQIFKTFSNSQEDLKIEHASDKNSLKSILENNFKKIVLTTIHKFEENITPLDFDNVFVFSDESHRSQYSDMSNKLRTALPKAKHIAFTGTPINKTSDTFGKVIDSYTMKESVSDQVTLPLSYQARYLILDDINKNILNNIASSLEHKEKKAMLNTKMAYKSKDRIIKIAFDMVNHYKKNIMPEGFKAMFVAEDRESAKKIKEALEQLKEEGIHNLESRVVFSIDHNDPEEYKELVGTKEEMVKVYTDFKKKTNPVKILIVSDMLLTGYDAAIIKALYLDKNLKDHTLFQAITRVNRVAAGKGFGLIVDYRGIAEHLNKTIKEYNKGDFEISNLEELKNEYLELKDKILDLLPEKFELSFDKLLVFFAPKHKEMKEVGKLFVDMQSILTPIFHLLEKEDLAFYSMLKRVVNSLKEDNPQNFISSERISLMQDYLDQALSFAIENLGNFRVNPEGDLSKEESTERNNYSDKESDQKDSKENDIFISEELELLLKERDLENKQSILDLEKEESLEDLLKNFNFEKKFINKVLPQLTKEKLKIEDNYGKIKGDLTRQINRIKNLSKEDKKEIKKEIINKIKKEYIL